MPMQSTHTLLKVELADEIAGTRDDRRSELDGLDAHEAVLPGRLEHGAELADDERVEDVGLEVDVLHVERGRVVRPRLGRRGLEGLDLGREPLDDDLEPVRGVELDLRAPSADCGATRRRVSTAASIKK